jgi:hypothetical protein
LRFFTSNHSRPVAATIKTTMMLHGADVVGSSLGVDDFDFASSAFVGAVGCTVGTVGGIAEDCAEVVWLGRLDFGNAPLVASASSLLNEAS